MATRKKQKKVEWKKQLTFELIGLFLIVLASVSFASLGSVGEGLTHLFRFFLGEWHVALTIGLFFISLYLMIKRKSPNFMSRRLVGIYLLVFSFVLLSHIRLFDLFSKQGEFIDGSVIRNTWELYWLQVKGDTSITDLGGGMVGAIGFAITHFLFAASGTVVFSLFIIITGIILITGKSFTDIILNFLTYFGTTFSTITNKIKTYLINVKQQFHNKWEEKKQKQTEKSPVIVTGVSNQEDGNDQKPQPEPIIYDFSKRAYETDSDKTENNSHPMSSEEETAEKEVEVHNTGVSKEALIVSVETNENYLVPSLELLQNPKKNNQFLERQHISANAKKLEQTLESFGVKAKVSKVHLGPAVTKYEVYPNIGVKVSKIVNLADDLALALAAKDIRIEAPIPGKSAIGIEVPNQEVAIVTLKEVLDATTTLIEASKLLIGLGRDISGDPVLAELNKMPHLLVAGATGSGKSVCINGIIVSILMRAKPHEVKLMMIDPKMVELNVYNGIPHLLAPVVTEPKKASQALKKVVNEMERRYELFAHTGTRNIEGYNTLIKNQNETSDAKQATLPYIVVIVDELADLMMVASSDVEDSITRLAQMARAAGIHLIIATQRPSVDVITGVIKANIPSRIAFGVSSQTDSRTILDMGGAEKLLGRGDMLFLPVGASKPVRVQGAFLSDDEVEKIVNFVIAQQKAQYQEDMMPKEEDQASEDVGDDLYESAVDLVTEMNTASVSMLQRRFRIGYTRAARLIDEMEARGIVGPYEGSKPREVLVSKRTESDVSSG
ncbi:cell division protein FtsK [Anaerobacillus alkalidiazotrophicus]|uniref:Cell division protein FtsK n=1 Tax=Anaerobacillus alkalidiazotrophicus TaxID=472963 RepID=A0A1S2M008_9BACI|nr:DNA translocase FtsK [Anaerobacillus alkalidiazotrophicus]OIJ17894.1 cell division protein FtsK [Anaerobacillus alkalidiazotrophicus]